MHLRTLSTAISQLAIRAHNIVTLSHFHICEATNWWIHSQLPVQRPSSVSKYAFNLARSRPLKSISKVVQFPPASASQLSVHYGLQVYLQPWSIMASKFPRLWPPSASPNSLGHNLGVHLQVHLLIASMCISKYAQLPSPHQQNVFSSLGTARSVWEEAECKVRRVNCKRESDPTRAFRPALWETWITDD